MTVLDTRSAPAEPGVAMRPATLPPAVTAFSYRLAGDLCPAGRLSAALVNAAIVEIAREDIAAGCLVWRQATNLVRVCRAEALADIAADITSGHLAASVFGSRTVAARLPDGNLHVTGCRLMTTGVAYAAWFVTEARREDGGTVLVAVPANGVTKVNRPSFIGLDSADNAFVDVDAVVPADRVLGTAEELIGLPYDLGLTMGAVAVGAAESILDRVEGLTDAELVELGELRAQLAAAAALVEVTPRHAPNAGWWSKAAKVAATNTALATCVAVRRLVGSATYAADHPLNRIEADLRGIEGQAPAHSGAARAVSGPATVPDPNRNNNQRK